MPPVEDTDLQRLSYDSALAEQRRFFGLTREDSRTRILLVEHDPPVITLGRRGVDDDLLVSSDEIAQRGIDLREAARGGQATWHGPGQLIAYVIRRLGRGGRSVHGHVRLLEEATIATLEQFDIDAHCRDGTIGVWIGDRKIAAVGVAVERWIAWHGLALNVNCDLSNFDLIVPCGDRSARPTSVAEVLGQSIAVEEVAPVLLGQLSDSLAAPGKGFLHPSRRNRMPVWLKKGVPAGGVKVRSILDELGLATVCTSARCPNRAECFDRKTATFMILGTRCTRNCRFCAVDSARPELVRPDEPEAVAEAADRLGLRHVVITSVTRDDLPDGGSGHFARTIAAVRERMPDSAIEVLAPDFRGEASPIDTVLDAQPDVFNHNIETVPRLYATVRPQADYRRSLAVLARAAARGDAGVKSGLMVGLGETHDEVLDVMRLLRAAGCRILTIGQYLSPTDAHLPVERFVEPSEFDAWRVAGQDMGFDAVAAGPFVRSSYRANEVFTPLR